MNQPQLFFAPRSNETSRDNFLSTLDNGYPLSDINEYLNAEEQDRFSKKKSLYIWGNQPAKSGSWKKMSVGDYVAFYAKGEFVYVGRCVHKKHSEALARNLWGNTPGKETTWEYTFFLDEIRPIKLPLSEIQALAGYKENMIVQGFMPINKEGLERIYETYGSLVSFFDVYSSGIKTEDFVKLDKISEKDEPTEDDAEIIDEIFRRNDPDVMLRDFEQKLGNEVPQVIRRKVEKVKRNQDLVKTMKLKYNNECQICGFTFEKLGGGFYSEVAHIKPIYLGTKGLDTPSNMAVLCPNHHKMLDLGNLKIISKESYSVDGKIKLFKTPLFE